MNNSTNLFVLFYSYTTDDQNVKYKLDDGGVKSIWMEPMNGGDVIGVWSGGRAIPMVKGMFGKDQMVLAYKSHSNHNLEFIFDISGLRDQIPELAEACNWTP